MDRFTGIYFAHSAALRPRKSWTIIHPWPPEKLDVHNRA
jgi:hypothetical protein